ncbi:TonB-dependent receptor [Flavobacterium zepuense]|uniref:TonB-dependent receptor n=1 Tax=Flavobacterium zepuense TaxID=2593302 RepID=A0A552V8C9_9FLAO|nr:TonB-dependent receptor [Flavobacterium zepuense]TRW26721.1 TonB-dependent receptor [Flavobacterium zepuense]
MNTNILKNVIFSITLLFSLTTWAQDRATLTGTINLSGNTPAENISVALKGTSHGAITNAQGQYEIKNVKPGTYTLRIAAIGITPVEESVTLASGEKQIKDFTLSESQEQLNEVVINGNANRFARTKSDIVSKMPLKDIENPQVYNTVTAELLKEQVVTNFEDALKNVPGLDKLWESTGRGGDGAGYFSLRGFAVQPTMVNGLPSITNGSPDPQNVERIEVLKGPSGTLFGGTLTSYGGLINITTKKPYDAFGGNISYTGGTYGLNRYTLDVNTPLNEDKTAAVRLNAAYHTENSFQDAGFRKSFFVAPSLFYKPSEKLTFYVNTEFYNNRGTNQTMLFLDRGAELRVHNIDELKYDNKRSYTGNDLYMNTPTFSLQAQMNYKINEHWTSQTVFSRTSAKSDGYYSYLYEGTQYTDVTDGIVLGRYISKQNSETYGTDIQQNFIGDFNLGQFRNRIIVGVDYFNRNTVNNSSSYVGNGSIYIGDNLQQFNELVLGITDPTQYVDETGVLNQAGTDALIAGTPISPLKTKEEIFSAYASDVFNITPAISAMASLRVDRFSNKGNINVSEDDYNQTAFSPKFGLVYQPILDKVSIFANYMNGFSNVAPVITGSRTFTFEAEQANQFEVGTKLNLLNDRITATFSYYDIKVDNTVLEIIPQVEYTQGGKRYSKGFEASLAANPIDGLNVIAGYSYNDSELTASTATDEFANRRPESAGPQNLVNFWASYRFQNATLKGFGLGFGGNYASENKIFNRTLAGTFTLPEYTVLNASAFYTEKAFTITLKLDNITDKDYYKGWSTISPQKPRIFAANLTYNF